MVSVSRPTPKTRRSLFSLKKAAASREVHSEDQRAPTGTSIASEGTKAGPSSSRPPLVSQGSSSSWIEDYSPPSSPTKSRQSSDPKAQMSSSHSPTSAPFKFPALRKDRVVEPAQTPAKAALTTGSSPSRPRSRSSPGDRALARLVQHSKNRSHFSIPDVMVTAAEEDGEEVYFEVEVPADDRRMKLHTDSAVADGVASQSQDAGYEGEGADVEQPPRKSLGGKMMPFLRRESSERDEVSGAVSTTSQTSTASASRAPKKAISGIFGKKEKKVETAAPAASTPAEAMVPRSNSPYGHPGSAFDSSGSLPLLSSKDSLPSSSTSSHFPRTPPASESTFPEDITGRKSAPGVSAVSNASVANTAASKKQRKANQKEELALIKELAKIDKMVREHDARARKEAAATTAAASTTTTSVKTPSRMMTIFAARKKGPAPARKVSVVKRSASNAGRERRASAQHSNSGNGISYKAGTSASMVKAPTAVHSATSASPSSPVGAAEPFARPQVRSSLDGGDPSDESDGRPSFSGVEWSADLPATALSSKSGVRYPGLSTDETLDFTLSSESELPVGVTLPREDSAVIPLAAVAHDASGEEVDEEEAEVESVSPSSTWSEGIHKVEDDEEQQVGVAISAPDRAEVESESSSAASPTPAATPLTRQVSPPDAPSTLPPRPPRRQNSAPAPPIDDARDDGSASRPLPLQSVSTNKMRGPASSSGGASGGQMMSFKPGQIIPDTLPSATGTRCDSPSLRYASKMAGGGSPSGPTEYTPFRAAMMSAGPTVVADRAGQRM